MSAPKTVLKLPARQTAQDAQMLFENLRALDPTDAIEIDARDVERINVWVAQILIAARRKWAGQSSFCISNPSPGFAPALHKIGLEMDVLMQGKT